MADANMGQVWGPVLGWYIAVQLCALAGLPWALRFLPALPDRGYALAKILGILLVGYIFWLATALGITRNETGGAWLILAVVALGGWAIARIGGSAINLWQALRGISRLHVVWVELLFAAGLIVWAVVRSYDPAANHTEQPMDLMLLNSIWHSPTYPPQDAWLAGYAIGYYYMGYWLLATLARLANTPPEIAYNAGQAAWFGLLLASTYGVGYNLTAIAHSRHSATGHGTLTGVTAARAYAAGILTACGVALAGNMQTWLEWLYANGILSKGAARWALVNNFPDSAQVTHAWYISDAGWWWWRSSRVLSDRNLLGGHIEVIDEFPSFSYVLGDNHPHVMAMPVALLAIGFALQVLTALAFSPRPGDTDRWWTLERFPGSRLGLGLVGLVVGSLLFLNTWDFPPYWGLIVLASAGGYSWMTRRPLRHTGWKFGAAVGGALLLGAGLAYFPYFLTAQSQAGGLVPNLFNPTRLPQFLVMFGGWVPAVAWILIVAGRRAQPPAHVWLVSGAIVVGIPLVFLVGSAGFALSTDAGQRWLASMPLPPEAAGYGAIMLERWLAQGWTFLLVGLALTSASAVLWRWFEPGFSATMSRPGLHLATGFALCLIWLGLALVYVPEFVFLRDQFGTRMNTVFKFYYQAWLLLGTGASFMIVQSIRIPREPMQAVAIVVGLVSTVLIGGALLFPFAATYSKTGGFASTQRTLDATAYVRNIAPEAAAALAWIRMHVPPQARILEGEGRAYSPEHNRVSTMTGRPTLLGWTGHERQWRGEAYGEMAHGRAEAIEAIYRSRDPRELEQLLQQWQIDYVYVSGVERRDYQMTEANEQVLARTMEQVFGLGDVQIYRFVPRVREE